MLFAAILQMMVQAFRGVEPGAVDWRCWSSSRMAQQAALNCCLQCVAGRNHSHRPGLAAASGLRLACR